MRITINRFDDDLIKHKKIPIKRQERSTACFRGMNKFAVVMIKAISGSSFTFKILGRDISSNQVLTGRQSNGVWNKEGISNE